ncbi:MAG TPA: DUF11 domain-containing protein, partial [Roseiflexaceae bacterium]|nr:DUF11 domain-containing protein [Roseiflexaceae bacterium]
MKQTHRTTLAAGALGLCAAALLALAGTPAGAPRAVAAPRPVITNTPEPPTPQPTSPPATPRPTDAPPPRPTDVPPTRPPENDGNADPALAKAVEPATARVGDEVLFVLTVTNRGNDDAKDVVVTDEVPGPFAVLGAEAGRGDVSVSGNTVVVTLGSMAPDEVVVIRIRARVTAAAPDVSNTATLVTSSRADDATNNVSGVTL